MCPNKFFIWLCIFCHDAHFNCNASYCNDAFFRGYVSAFKIVQYLLLEIAPIYESLQNVELIWIFDGGFSAASRMWNCATAFFQKVALFRKISKSFTDKGYVVWTIPQVILSRKYKFVSGCVLLRAAPSKTMWNIIRGSEALARNFLNVGKWRSLRRDRFEHKKL